MPGGCVEMFSITETKAKKMCKKFPVEYSMYSQNQLSRVYPHALRIDSSNFNPAIFWQCGCQMAAMNYQTNDVALQYYNCMFQQNNGAGYLLKPLVLIFWGCLCMVALGRCLFIYRNRPKTP
jgi:hypothetical protein